MTPRKQFQKVEEDLKDADFALENRKNDRVDLLHKVHVRSGVVISSLTSVSSFTDLK